MKIKIKVLMLVEFFYPYDRGGSEWSVFYLTKSLIQKGLKVKVFTPNYGGKSEAIYKGIKIYRFPFYRKLHTSSQSISPVYFNNPLWFVVSLYYLTKEIIKYRPNIIHIHGKYFLPSAIIVGKIFGIKTITTLRDYIVLCPYGLCINSNNKFHACSLSDLFTKDFPKYYSDYVKRKNMYRYVLNIGYAAYGYVTSSILRYFLKLSDIKVAISQRVAYIYRTNKVVINKVIYNTYEFNNKIKIIHKPKNQIIYIGRLTPGKGIEILLSAYKLIKYILKKKTPKLIIVGDNRIWSKSRLDKTVVYMGHLSNRKTLNLLNQSKLLVVPSIWEEPFGRVALEALAHNVPVVASNKGALSEIILDNRYGRVVKPDPKKLAQAIFTSIYKNKYLRINIHKDFNQITNKFNIEPISQYIKLYETIIK